jgi:bifunctional pyridoxal-dependent enzyme with beta-cystathionase and maltose regulon repressor activities
MLLDKASDVEEALELLQQYDMHASMGYTGLYLSAGRQYGKCGEAFMRMNVACTRETLLDGMERLNRGVELYEKWKDNHKWN